MDTKKCPDGHHWDILLKFCVSKRTEPVQKPHPTTESVLMVVDQLRTKTTTAKASTFPTMLVLSQTMWICVVLIILGSVLTLIIWFDMFRRQTRVSRNFEDPVPEQEPLQKTEQPEKVHPVYSERNGHACQRPADTLSPCHLWLEDGFSACRGPMTPGSKEGGGGLPECSSDHRVPCPATELEGTALVTTKTL